MRKPLLPLDPTLRQRAIGVATSLINEFTKGSKHGVPIAKYALEICKIFGIPLLPNESAETVTTKKLQEWRAQISFRMVTDASIESVLPQLEMMLGTIRQAISSKLATRDRRQQANASRHNSKYRPKHRNVSNVRPLDFPEGDPYAD